MSLQKKTHFSESEIFRLLDYHHQIMVEQINSLQFLCYIILLWRSHTILKQRWIEKNSDSFFMKIST